MHSSDIVPRQFRQWSQGVPRACRNYRAKSCTRIYKSNLNSGQSESDRPEIWVRFAQCRYERSFEKLRCANSHRAAVLKARLLCTTAEATELCSELAGSPHVPPRILARRVASRAMSPSVARVTFQVQGMGGGDPFPTQG